MKKVNKDLDYLNNLNNSELFYIKTDIIDNFENY